MDDLTLLPFYFAGVVNTPLNQMFREAGRKTNSNVNLDRYVDGPFASRD
jgi:hypothetical protein